MMMSSTQLPNRVRSFRESRGWSQHELAARAGISRTGISAIEAGRLVPSVATALALGAAFNCRVEDLFAAEPSSADEPVWATPPQREPCRYWRAKVGARLVAYPTEPATSDIAWHDGLFAQGKFTESGTVAADDTLALACCDPAAGLLAAEYRRTTPFRLVVLRRSSQQALDMLQSGLVHVAGIHLSFANNRAGNATAMRETLSGDHCLLRVARWQEGLAMAPGWQGKSARDLQRSRGRWVGREPGSGARRCLDEFLEGRAAPRHIARDHHGVAAAIASGWADLGVCHRFVSEEAGLGFLPLHQEDFDFCFSKSLADDPRLAALLDVVRSSAYRRALGELPGYDTRRAGELQDVLNCRGEMK